MGNILLAHGGWHGGWCWDPILPGIRAAGHHVVALDLPGHGDDRTPISEVTRESCVDRLLEHIDATTAPVILVGHSMSGILIAQAAELRPDRVAALVYVVGIIPESGPVIPQIAGLVGGDSLILTSFVLDERAGTTTLSPGSVSTLFYGLCDPVVAERAEARLRPESTAALGGEVTVTSARAGSVPRYFVECLHDKAFPIEFQREMLRRFHCKQVFTLDADHSPFYSATGEFVNALLAVAGNHPTPGATKLW
jgi:pimeloyl-ACP methyl ester carboxylesterase